MCVFLGLFILLETMGHECLSPKDQNIHDMAPSKHAIFSKNEK